MQKQTFDLLSILAINVQSQHFSALAFYFYCVQSKALATVVSLSLRCCLSEPLSRGARRLPDDPRPRRLCEKLTDPSGHDLRGEWKRGGVGGQKEKNGRSVNFSISLACRSNRPVGSLRVWERENGVIWEPFLSWHQHERSRLFSSLLFFFVRFAPGCRGF